MKYDVIIIGAGPGGIFAAYELMQLASDLKVAVFESATNSANVTALLTVTKSKAVSAAKAVPL